MLEQLVPALARILVGLAVLAQRAACRGVILLGEVEVVAQLLVRLAAVMERLEVAAVALDHVAVHGVASRRSEGGSGGVVND